MAPSAETGLVASEVALLADQLRSESACKSPGESSAITSEDMQPTQGGDAWKKLPRESWPLGKYLLLLPQDIRGELFFRHALLNPRDHRLGLGDQDQLNAVLEVVGTRFRDFVDAQSKMATLDSEQATPADLTELPSSEASVMPGKRPGEMTYSAKLNHIGLLGFRDNKVYRVRSPHFDSTLHHRAYLIEEVGSSITEWFRSRGCCSTEEANEIVAEVFATAEATYVNRK